MANFRERPPLAGEANATAPAHSMRRVRLRWIATTAAAAAAVVATAALGQWQLHRAAQKEAYQAQLDARAGEPVVQGQHLLAERAMQEPQALQHRRVLLQGQWLAEHTVFLDNRQMQGRPGFYVLTPLRLAGMHQPGHAQTVLVQRGWVARNFQDRNALPQIATPPGQVQVQGRIAGQPARLLELGRPASCQGACQIRQNIDTVSFAREIGEPLALLTVVQTGAPSEGLLRDWPVVGSGVQKHYGYAFQWFGLCSLIAILYVWFQIVRPCLRQRR